MTLRPISFGEILDGTFTLYRRYYSLFVGIAALPHAVWVIAHLLRQALSEAGAGQLAIPRRCRDDGRIPAH